MAKRRSGAFQASFEKVPSGIQGLDEITGGGLPKGRPTLVCGSAGAGKTLMAMEFLVRGATDYKEPGVFVAFEENAEELVKNVASLGFDLDDLQNRKKVYLEHIRVERSEIEETGEYDLEALFIRIDYAVKSIGAKRVVLDTIESLFSGLPNVNILRAELRRLFRWMKNQGLTAVITAERGEGQLTRHGLEEYVADCVILLDHRVDNQVSTRRLRVVKYRGSTHGTNEYPFIITEKGISILPITSLGLTFDVGRERISSGIPRLDTMLGGKGYYLGSSILVSGTAGTGKSSIAASFADKTCSDGKKCVYFAFEESPQQIIRNMSSIGMDLGRWVKNGRLQFHAARPTLAGLEMHLVTKFKVIEDFEPDVVILDPITNFTAVGIATDVQAMLTRLLDYLKSRRITSLFTSLTRGTKGELDAGETAVSSLMDTWILVRDIEMNGERNRGIYILKSRGMAHSNQIREFIISDKGIDLKNVYVGPGGFLLGTARAEREISEKTTAELRRLEVKKKQQESLRRRKALEDQIAVLEAEIKMNELEMEQYSVTEQAQEAGHDEERVMIGKLRQADGPPRPEARRTKGVRR